MTMKFLKTTLKKTSKLFKNKAKQWISILCSVILRAKVLDFIKNTVFSTINSLNECQYPIIRIKAKTSSVLVHEISFSTPKGAQKISKYLLWNKVKQQTMNNKFI